MANHMHLVAVLYTLVHCVRVVCMLLNGCTVLNDMFICMQCRLSSTHLLLSIITQLGR